MPSTNQKGRNADHGRYSGVRQFEDGDPLLERPNPQSLTMGPSVIFRNALGEPEACAMTEEWRPRFTVKSVSVIEEFSTWTQ